MKIELFPDLAIPLLGSYVKKKREENRYSNKYYANVHSTIIHMTEKLEST